MHVKAGSHYVRISRSGGRSIVIVCGWREDEWPEGGLVGADLGQPNVTRRLEQFVGFV